MDHFTYQDAVEHGTSYLAGAGEDDRRDARRCVLQAYRALANAHPWSYLATQGRIITSAPYSTGTIEFDLTGGDFERLVELTDGTWPSWAGLGAHLRIDDVMYEVAERVSDTRITLQAALSPAADLDPETDYVLYRDVYLLPEDFVAGDTVYSGGSFAGMEFVAPNDWIGAWRASWSTGTPRAYSITGDSRFPGRLVLRFWPSPDQAKSVDFLYARRPRYLRTEQYDTGTATNEAGSTTVTGAGTAWTSVMAGSVLRLGTARVLPTSWIGSAPPTVEVRILDVVSATELRVAEAVAVVHSEVRYIISDPVDVEQGAMLDAFLRGVEKFLHIARAIKDKPDAFAAYDMALREAKAADSRSMQPRSMGGGPSRRVAVKDMPVDFS